MWCMDLAMVGYLFLKGFVSWEYGALERGRGKGREDGRLEMGGNVIFKGDWSYMSRDGRRRARREMEGGW